LVLRVSDQAWFRSVATRTTPGRAVASRFVAGEELHEALDVAARLDRARITSMLDHLGENVDSPERAVDAARAYTRALEAIAKQPQLDSAISVKLTQLGLDFSQELCVSHLTNILEAAEPARTLVMIDMESHDYIDRTLDVFRTVHRSHPEVGVALQSYLRRTGEDIFQVPEGCRVRLVKGAYLESREIAFANKREVDGSWRQLFATLLSRGHRVDAATHDPALIEGVRKLVDRTDGGWSRVEFQMLYGVRRDLQVRLASQGYPVRVYIPYGTEWYPYLTRRLAERPANLWFFVSNLVRRAR
jgi:proline dehydrogenase